MNTRNLPLGKERPASFWDDCLENVGASMPHNPTDLTAYLILSEMFWTWNSDTEQEMNKDFS
jgi:hypothetical protein